MVNVEVRAVDAGIVGEEFEEDAVGPVREVHDSNSFQNVCGGIFPE